MKRPAESTISVYFEGIPVNEEQLVELTELTIDLQDVQLESEGISELRRLSEALEPQTSASYSASSVHYA